MSLGCPTRAGAGIASARSKASGDEGTLQTLPASYGLAGSSAPGGAPTTGVIRKAIAHKVEIWRGTKWVEDPDLIATGDLHIPGGREIGTATFTHHYGKILRLRDRDFRTYDPEEEDLAWRFARFSAAMTMNEGGPDQKVEFVPVFYGVIVAPNARREELRSEIVAFDFRYLMQGVKNARGWFEAPQWSVGSANIVDFRGLELNDNEIHNLPIQGPDDPPTEIDDVFAAGNRSEQKYDPGSLQTDTAEGTTFVLPSTADDAVYIFGGAGGSENIWTHQQILDYYVALYLNRESNKPGGFPIKWRVAGADLLDSTLLPDAADQPADEEIANGVRKIAQLDFRNKSMLEIVDMLCRSAGDLSWRLSVSEEGATHVATITIFDRSMEVDSGGGSFRQADLATGVGARPKIVDIDNPNTDYTPRSGHVVKDSSARCNRLIVVGARRRYLTTLAPFRKDGKDQHSLVRGWTEEAENGFTANLDAANPENGADFEARNREAEEPFDEVFRRFVVPDQFNWGDVEPLTDTAPRRAIFPQFLLEQGADGSNRSVKRDGPFPNDAVNFWFHPRKFLPKLPIKVGYDYTFNPPVPVLYADRPPKGVGELMKSLLFSVNVTAALEVVRALDYAAGPPLKRLQDFQELEDTAGIKLSQYAWNITRNPDSAKIDMTGRSEVQDEKETDLWPYDGNCPDDLDDSKIAPVDDDSPGYQSWLTLAATVCLEADDRLMYTVEDAASIARGDPVRTLVIENEEYHYWEARDALIDDNATRASTLITATGLDTITVANATGIVAGQKATAPGLAAGSRVLGIVGLVITLSCDLTDAAEAIGKTVTFGSPLVIGVDGSPYVLRDDSQKIIRYANRTFRKLSGEKREAAIGFDYLDFTWEPGMYVGWVRKDGPAHVRIFVGAAVMSVVHNLQENRTTLKTQYDIAVNMDDLV